MDTWLLSIESIVAGCDGKTRIGKSCWP